jgi:hypothetical protein
MLYFIGNANGRVTHAAFDMWILVAEEHPVSNADLLSSMDPGLVVLWQATQVDIPVLKENAAVVPI